MLVDHVLCTDPPHTHTHNISFHSYNNAFETNIEVPRFQMRTFGYEDMRLKEIRGLPQGPREAEFHPPD